MRKEADSPFLHWAILWNWNFSKVKPLLVTSYVRMQSHVVWYTGSTKTLVLMYKTMHCHVSDHGNHCDKILFNSLQLLCCTQSKLAVTQIMCYIWQLTLRLVHIKMRELYSPSCTESVTRWNDQRFHISWKGMQCNIYIYIYIYRVFCLISKFPIVWMLIS